MCLNFYTNLRIEFIVVSKCYLRMNKNCSSSFLGVKEGPFYEQNSCQIWHFTCSKIFSPKHLIRLECRFVLTMGKLFCLVEIDTVIASVSKYHILGKHSRLT